MQPLRRGLLLLVVTGVLGLSPATAAAATWVSYPALYAQVRSGPLIRAIINPTRGDVEIKFRNLDEWHAYYPAGAESTLLGVLHARHVRVLFVPRPRPAAAKPASVHHRLRYIAAAALAALVLLGAGVIMYRRRRGAPRGDAGAPPA